MRLSLVDEAGRATWQVWPSTGAAIPPGAIQETGRYVFVLEGDESCSDAELLIDDESLEALRASPGSARWRWSPGFHAGTVDGVLRLANRPPVLFSLTTDPDLSKLTRSAFDKMVSEILEDSLALMSLSSFRTGVERGIGDCPPPVARLEFLRSRAVEVERVVLEIALAPRQRMAADSVRKPYHTVRQITGPQLARSLKSGRVIVETGRLDPVLPAELRGVFPSTLDDRRRFASVDTSENRQILASLKSWSEWLDAAALQLSQPGGGKGEVNLQRSKWARRCRTLSGRLRRLSHLPFFSDVAVVQPEMRLTAVFRRDSRYARFFRVWQDFQRGLANLQGTFLEVPIARTYQLYEHWCYLRLSRAAALIAQAEGAKVTKLFAKGTRGALTLTPGASSVSAGAITISFQRTYREYWTEKGAGSYSREMTPDLVLTSAVAAGSLMVVFDAKYRVGEAIRDAVASIHMYRDALVEEATGDTAPGRPKSVVDAAYVITPRMPGELGEDEYRETALPQRFFHPEYRRRFRFGGFIMSPGMALGDVVNLLRSVLRDAEPAQA